MRIPSVRSAVLAVSLLGLSASGHALIVGFEGILPEPGTASFDELGIENTYLGFQWRAADSVEQQPPLWGVDESLTIGGVSAFEGTAFGWTYNGGRSLFVTFGGEARTVVGAYVAGLWFPQYSSGSVQMLGYDAADNVIARSGVLNLVDSQWRFMAGGLLATTPVHKLELRSDAADTWFGVDHLEIDGVVPEPASLVLLGLGLVTLGNFRLRFL